MLLTLKTITTETADGSKLTFLQQYPKFITKKINHSNVLSILFVLNPMINVLFITFLQLVRY